LVEGGGRGKPGKKRGETGKRAAKKTASSQLGKGGDHALKNLSSRKKSERSIGSEKTWEKWW